MPTTCEVCGTVDDSAADEYLHVCPDCLNDRRYPEEAAVVRTEDSAD